MKIFKKTSEEAWRQWRREGIGASDIPIIRGLSPYKSRAQLLLEKVEGQEVTISDFVQSRAMDREYEARHKLNQMHEDLNLEPICIYSARNHRHKASLDGFDAERGVLFEHKCTGREKFQAMDKFDFFPTCIKEKMWLEQIVWQMFLIGKTRCHEVVLSVSPLQKGDVKFFWLPIDWKLARTIYKRQMGDAKKFLGEWDDIIKHKESNQGDGAE